jgi:hypothetical protein
VLTHDEARPIATNIAKRPELLSSKGDEWLAVPHTSSARMRAKLAGDAGERKLANDLTLLAPVLASVCAGSANAVEAVADRPTVEEPQFPGIVKKGGSSWN